MNYINTLQEALLKVHNKRRISDLYSFEDQTVPGTFQEYEYLCKVNFLCDELKEYRPALSAQHLTKKEAKQEAAQLALSILPLLYLQNNPAEYLKNTIHDLQAEIASLKTENTALRQQVERLMQGNMTLYSRRK